jgi:hypothetical protein
VIDEPVDAEAPETPGVEGAELIVVTLLVRKAEQMDPLRSVPAKVFDQARRGGRR